MENNFITKLQQLYANKKELNINNVELGILVEDEHEAALIYEELLARVYNLRKKLNIFLKENAVFVAEPRSAAGKELAELKELEKILAETDLETDVFPYVSDDDKKHILGWKKEYQL